MIEVISIPTFSDNYVWLIKNTRSNHCCVVDPGHAEPVQQVITQQGLILDAILITHHHYDHIDGVSALIDASSQQVHTYSSLPMTLTSPLTVVADNSELSLLDGALNLTVMATPGHKSEHVVFHNAEMLFCGDTLFSGGCGRILEGTATALFQSLQKILTLNEQVSVYPAHEYTQANLMFCHAVEPRNIPLKKYIKHAAKLRQQGLPTLPSSLKKEKQINVFLRTDEPTVRCAVEHQQAEVLNSEQAVFTALRAWKDRF
jgi:hydroxyacylglutathione hydrolase